jgi:general secretion pathway protein B
MSYILEALKKSEKDRQRDEIPDLQADHSLSPMRRVERKSRSWRLPAVIVLVLFCGAGLLWWQLDTEKKVQSVVAEVPPVTPAPSSVQKVQAPEAEKSLAKSVDLASEGREKTAKNVNQAVAQSAAQPNSIPPAAVAEKKSIPVKKIETRSSVEQAEPVPPLMEELPDAVRATIPDLSFAGHVYSNVPQKRLIIINNRIVREGDLIDNGLSLEKIDPDGVVLRYETLVFRVKLF